MRYSLNIKGFEGQNIQAEISYWSGPKLLVNGMPVQKGKTRADLLLQRNDGRQVPAYWKMQGLGFDVPQLVVDNEVIKLVEPLKWFEWLWGGLPLFLVFIGGFFGALTGLLGFFFNAQIFRTRINGFLKYLATGAISGLAVVVYFFLSFVLSLLLQK
jgi:hypothetical protein